ncbi:uncharacterized protein LOC141614810 [Silene latifolia]|uniref:uncharacterized protein LOC141614810 n=1 Tax=Silene latifolia TaxID=37657 RepID=UPI003D76D37A
MGSCISHHHSKHHKGLSDDRIHHLPPINGNYPDAPSPQPPPPPPPLTLAPPSVPATFDPPIAYPYDAPQVETEAETETGDFKLVAGGNQNKVGEQEVEAVEFGNTSGDNSSIFKRKGGNIDIQIGNNINEGVKQKIGKISIGNAISAGA